MQDDIWLRLLCALLAGTALGLERESHGRAAGLRTTVLVCIAPCLGMLLSEHFYAASFNGGGGEAAWHPDPMRLAAGVLAGMGFIGAGVIIKQGDMVRGVTTASVLWLASFLGMAFGAGQYAVGFGGLVLSIAVVLGFPFLERGVASDWYSVLTVVTRAPTADAAALCALVERHGVKVKQSHVAMDLETGTKTHSLRLRYKKHDLIALPEQLVAEIAALPGVRRISCD